MALVLNIDLVNFIIEEANGFKSATKLRGNYLGNIKLSNVNQFY